MSEPHVLALVSSALQYSANDVRTWQAAGEQLDADLALVAALSSTDDPTAARALIERTAQRLQPVYTVLGRGSRTAASYYLAGCRVIAQAKARALDEPQGVPWIPW